MISRYIQSFTCCFPDPGNELQAVAELIPDIPKRAARRMSNLGKQVHHVLAKLPMDMETSLVYGTTYTEARALETFLDSIPFASPTAFQTSIHPGGIEQALIMNKQEVASLFPIAGNRLVFLHMLQTALTCKSHRVILVGGEEKGSWLQDFDLAHDCSFAFSLELGVDAMHAIGKIQWDQQANPGSGTVPSLEQATRAMKQSNGLIFGTPDHGQYSISWK